LKDMLGRIQTNSGNCHLDGSPWLRSPTSQPGTFDAVGGRPPQHFPMGTGLRRCGGVFDDNTVPGSTNKSYKLLLIGPPWRLVLRRWSVRRQLRGMGIRSDATSSHRRPCARGDEVRAKEAS